MNALTIINSIAGLVVLAEALRCLEHARPLDLEMTWRQWAAQVLGVLAWLAVASASAIALASPLLSVAGPPICWAGIALSIGAEPALAEVFLMTGAAGVVVRGWCDK